MQPKVGSWNAQLLPRLSPAPSLAPRQCCPRAAPIARPQQPAAAAAASATAAPNEGRLLLPHARLRRPCAFARAAEKPAQGAGSSQHPFPEEADFDLLSSKIADVTLDLSEELCGCSIYLVGMMGSGKSTLGKMLANTLKYAFFDTDTMVEMTHDKRKVSDIFQEYGEEYFRGCEAEVLKQLAPYKNLVVATGGGAVTRSLNWSYLHAGVVVWLNGPTDLLAKRVAKEGLEKRPLLTPSNSGGSTPSEEELRAIAQGRLGAILAERRKFYDSADLKVSLEGYCEDAEEGAPTAVVMYRLLCALRQRIEETKQERADRQNFKIENKGEIGWDLPTMQVKQSPMPQQQPEQQQDEQPES